MTLEESEESLLKRAREEEQNFNWIQAASYYEKLVNYYLDKNFIEKAADKYKNLGYSYTRTADTVESAEEYLKQINSAIKAYKEAKNLFKEIENKSGELECEAEVIFLSGVLTTSDIERKDVYRQAHKLFNESSKFYSMEENEEGVARTLSKAANAIFLLTYCEIDQQEQKKLGQKGREMAGKGWEIAKRIGNIQILSESFNLEWLISINELTNLNFKQNEYWKEYMENYLLKSKETIELIDKYDDPNAFFLVFSAAGSLNCGYGYQYVEDEKDQ